MDLGKGISAYLGISSKETELEQGKITQLNLDRIAIASVLGFAISLLHAIYFKYAIYEADGQNLAWKEELFIVHSLLCLFFLIIFFSARNGQKDQPPYSIFHVHLSLLTSFGFLLAGAVIVSIDQKITTSITPFIIASLAASSIQIVRPIYSLIIFMIVDAVFVILMQQAQQDTAILTSNIVNGITISMVSLAISAIQWKSIITNLKQAAIIEKQKQDLEGNYQNVLKYSTELESANILKDKFFSIVAHDFKGPLSSIIGVIDLLLDKENKMSAEEQETLLVALKQSTNNTHKMLENVLLWARNQNGTLAFMPVVIFLHPKIESILDFFELQAKEKKVTLINNVPKNTMVYADNDMLVTILRNLISNALKFSFPLGKIEIYINQNEPNPILDFVVLCIKDNGVGMSKKHQDDLFRIDKNISKPGTNNEKGTGLGLILCKDLIEKNGGKIAIESSLTHGTTVHIQLPKKINAN